MSNKKWRQGIYTPKYTNKFLGTKATYRSGLELKFFRFCDNNPNVIKWGSENVVIPYLSPVDGKLHRYYVDNFIVIKEGNSFNKYLIEIKPSKQTKPPQTKYRKKQHLIYEQKQWLVNQSKWDAAKKYAKKYGWTFLIITEKELK